MKERAGSEQQQHAKAGRLPARFKAAEAVARRQVLEGSLSLAQLPRLAEALSGPAQPVQVQVRFGPYPRAVGRAEGRIQGVLPLTCQRTLEVFHWPLDVAFSWVLVASEADEERLLAEADPLMLEEEQLALHAAVEDEVLLALPIVPLKPLDDSASEPAPASPAPAGTPTARGQGKPGKTKAGGVSHNVELDDSRPNPFAVLKGQLRKN